MPELRAFCDEESARDQECTCAEQGNFEVTLVEHPPEDDTGNEDECVLRNDDYYMSGSSFEARYARLDRAYPCNCRRGRGGKHRRLIVGLEDLHSRHMSRCHIYTDCYAYTPGVDETKGRPNTTTDLNGRH